MVIDAADTAWVMISTALVMLMTPGVALFYAGMVRRKNVLSTIMMSFVMLALVSVLWLLYGYSLSFGPDKGGVIGGLDWVGLRQVGQEPSSVYATTVPHLAFMIFQAMFAVITVALITGAVVERIKFSAFLAFAALWLTFVYCPVAHWVWGAGGWLAKLGALDFAGGTVVHVNAGLSALALAILLGPRRGFLHGEPMEPHNVPMVALGAGLLWFGWFGFNAGSALTPAAGFVPPLAGIPIGMGAAAICYYCMLFRTKRRIDESLDVWAVHGMGGIWGALATGIFASVAVNSVGADGLLLGNALQFGKQLAAVAAVGAFAFCATLILGKIVDLTIGLRVGQTEETVGLDVSEHGERAYGGMLP